MISWNQSQLAEAAKVSRMTIVDFEKEARVPHPNNLSAVRSALEAAGIKFTDGDEPGVKLRPARAAAHRRKKGHEKEVAESGIPEMPFKKRE